MPTKPEIAGVSIPSPISMHMPNIARKSNILLATILSSKNLPSLLLVPMPSCKPEREILMLEATLWEERNPTFIFLQSREYKANVPPATNQLSVEVRNPSNNLFYKKMKNKIYIHEQQ